MRKLLLLTGALTLLLISCTQQEQKNLAIIQGKVLYDIDEIKFEWFKEHSADIKPQTYIAKVDSVGNFTVEIPIQQLSKGMMITNNQRYDLVLIPEDHIKVSITKDSIIYSGKGAEKNNFLQELSQNKKCSRMDIMMSWYREEHELNDFYIMIDEYINTRKMEFEKFSSSHTLQKEFIDYFNIENQLDYVDLYEQAVIAYSRKNGIPIDSLEIPVEFEKQYSIQGLLNDKYLVYSNYLHILNGMIRSNVERIINADTSLKRDEVKLSIIMDSLSGRIREHYLVQGIYYNLSIYDKYDSSMVSAFNTIKTDENCIKVVETELIKFNKKKEMIGAPLHNDFLQTILCDTSKTKMTIAEVLSKSKGKVIYLDIWSLGCGPCRMAMPLSKKLKEKLKDYPIEFIYLTVDNYSDKLWDEVFKVSLTQDNHYRFEKGVNSKLHELFNIMAIPAYILIDKKGNLVSYNAERPYNRMMQENPELEKILIDLASY